MEFVSSATMVGMGCAVLSAAVAYRASLCKIVGSKFHVEPCAYSAILITGTSSGIGKALAVRMINEGYLCFGTVRKEADGAHVLTELPTELHTMYVPVICDVTKCNEV